MKLTKMFSIMALLLVVSIAGCKKDPDVVPVPAPVVSSTDPAKDAVTIATNSKIVAIFSAAMDPATITSTTFTVQQGTTPVLGAVTYTGTTATFTPTENLEGNAVFTAKISTTVKNANGVALVQDYDWSFTTGAAPDIIVPTVVLTDPLNDALDLALDKAIVFTFSEPMNQTTINDLTFNLKQGSNAVGGAISILDNTVTFTPTSNLQYFKVYTATITTGAEDMAGNALAEDYSINFTTVQERIAPTILSTKPLNNDIAIERNKVIEITFSEEMNASTINDLSFTLMKGTTLIPGAVTYSSSNAKFTPTNVLEVNTLYTAKITTAAEDLAGNALETNTTWTFTTGGSASILAIVDLGMAGDYVILAKTKISNVPTSAITGDLGLSPAATSYVTGFPLTMVGTLYATAPEITGKVYGADMTTPTNSNLTTAVENMLTAYTDAAGRPLPDFVELYTGNIGGKTLSPGLYKWTNTVTIPSHVTISGGANDVWIFQIAGDLDMSSAVNINLIGGALAKNIFWQVAGEVIVGTGAHFEGKILSMTAITFKTGASLNGKALAQTAVILDSNIIVDKP